MVKSTITLTQDFDYFKFYKGDLIIVDHEVHPKNGDIVISYFNGDLRVHRFERPNRVASLWPPHDAGVGIDDLIMGVALKLNESQK